MSSPKVPEDLQIDCPLCKGSGLVEVVPFTDYQTNMVIRSCSLCHGKGKLWALDHQEMAKRIASLQERVEQLEAENQRLRCSIF